MYRRIELINHRGEIIGYIGRRPIRRARDYKNGLCGISPSNVVDAWIDHLRGTEKSLPQNCRFFFTEKGWDVIGRNVIAECMKVNQDYRVIAIKETDAQVVWRDKHTDYEVAVQPKSRKTRGQKVIGYKE